MRPISPSKFWSVKLDDLRGPEGTWRHPDDREDIDLLFKKMKENLNTFPCPFWGPIDTAKLVLCYAGPGSTENKHGSDRRDARNEEWLKERIASFNGTTPINFGIIHNRARNWFLSRIARVLDISKSEAEDLGAKVAIVDLTAYRGVTTTWEEVAFLPSTQMMRQWAKHSLFKEAKAKRRVVLVMRANKWWGVPSKPWSDGYLFTPDCNRSGFFLKKCDIGKIARNTARAAVGLHS